MLLRMSVHEYHESVKEISYSTSLNSRFHFSPYQFLFFFFVFPSHTFFFINEKKVVARSLLFFLSFSFPTGTSLKHSQNLSTGVSHSFSNSGTVKTTFAKRSIFFQKIYFFDPLRVFPESFYNLIFFHFKTISYL